MITTRLRVVSAIAGVAVATMLLSGCSAAAVSKEIKAVTTAEACRSVQVHIQPAEKDLKGHLKDVTTDPAAYEKSMDGLATSMADAAASTKNRSVREATVSSATLLKEFTDDFAAVESAKTAYESSNTAANAAALRAAATKLKNDQPTATKANASFTALCHFTP